jgi:hypothetical protein
VNPGILQSVQNKQGSLNFMALLGAANNKNTVYVTSSESHGLRFDTYTNTIKLVDFATDKNLHGVTLPSRYSGLVLSVVQVNPYQSARESAATMAHELYGHAYPCMQGRPCTHYDLPSQMFVAIENEAYSNFDQKP